MNVTTDTTLYENEQGCIPDGKARWQFHIYGTNARGQRTSAALPPSPLSSYPNAVCWATDVARRAGLTTVRIILRPSALREDDAEVIERIADRARTIIRNCHSVISRERIVHALCAAHLHRPLRLAELAEANDLDFTYDVFGLLGNYGDTGRESFVPRCSCRANNRG